jgi:hypothetical protein
MRLILILCAAALVAFKHSATGPFNAFHDGLSHTCSGGHAWDLCCLPFSSGLIVLTGGASSPLWDRMSCLLFHVVLNFCFT